MAPEIWNFQSHSKCCAESVFPHYGVALAPMRALSQPSFWRILNRYGPPNAYFSEFVRVHENYTIEKAWIESALESADSHPIWVQLMGNDLNSLTASVRVLSSYPIAGIDFNVGCPIPKIYKKKVGGGLLRNLPYLRTLLLELREVCEKPLSVKFRLGFDSTENFDTILGILNEAHIDLATLHARTVSDLYKAQPRYEFITHAVQYCHCPVLANGNIDSLQKMAKIFEDTRCWGLMIGRATLGNPWIFSQWHQHTHDQPIIYPTHEQIYQYIEDLFVGFDLDKRPELTALGCMKRFLNYIAPTVDHSDCFRKQVCTASNLHSFWTSCRNTLL